MITLHKTCSELSKTNYLFDGRVYFKVMSVLRLFKYFNENV